ncbi:acyltransferase [uncultured Corynebacterium sp.]|uniref:acyltransferase family protein n=1 Tax=uncultured Corynebacterium sp. TaxID=159447 RepID=UPI0025F7BAEA|nr:acyltransferase [uncultured Corynebacterium sp.]
MSTSTPQPPPAPTPAPQAGGRPPFLPALEGLRAVAALGIILTHAAFQTGNDTGAVVNRIMARTDFFVPVFFALSGFLLWRRHVSDFSFSAAGRRRWVDYHVKRLGRIMPAHLVLVVVVVALFPVAGDPGVLQIAANLLLLQNYVPDGMVGGLTHLWSLCVEMFLYLAMPLLALVVGRRRRAVRVVAIVAVGVLSALWPFLAGPRTGDLNPHIMPWAFFGSFCVGLLAAETEGWLAEVGGTTGAGRAAGTRGTWPDTVRRWAGRRPLWVALAAGVLVLASVDGPEGLTAASPAEFFRRTTCGVVFAATLVVPVALAPRSRFLESRVMQLLGRWSYSVFLWHMAVLSLVFPLLGISLFTGGYAVLLLVLAVTVGLSVPVAALSYALVEDPARRAVSRWWGSRGAVKGAEEAEGAEKVGEAR